MAKTTRDNGPSIAPVIIRRAELGRVDQACHGSNSVPSSPSEQKSKESPAPLPPPHAPTTENPSSAPVTEAVFTAPLTAGAGQTETRPPSARKRPGKTAQGKDESPKKARARALPTNYFGEF